jgi:hypothetical protein
MKEKIKMIEYINRERLVLQEQTIQLQMFDIDELVSKDKGRVSNFFLSSYFLLFRYHFLENEWQLKLNLLLLPLCQLQFPGQS